MAPPRFSTPNCSGFCAKNAAPSPNPTPSSCAPADSNSPRHACSAGSAACAGAAKPTTKPTTPKTPAAIAATTRVFTCPSPAGKRRTRCATSGVLRERRTVGAYRRTVDPNSCEGQTSGVISHRLVGRERELLELTTSLGRAKGGSGGALIVAGPPGIGKTRVAMELAAAAQADGVGVHWGRCWQGDVAPAFWPWVQVLRSMEADDSALRAQLVDVLALIAPRSRPSSRGAATTPADGFVILDQLASVVSAAARARTIVVVIEDLQWADASSLQAFAHIATTATGCPLLLIATLRSTDEASRTDLGELARLAPRVEIAALSDQETGELLAVALGEQPGELLLDRVLDTCGGNPFYIRAVAETARHGDADVFPPSVRGVVLGQLAALDESTRSLLAVASVLGHEFTTVALAENVDMPMILDALAQAEGAGVVRTVSFGTRYAFVHDLVREAIYGGLPAQDRAIIHQRAAAKLADHGDEFQVAARAYHTLAALPLGELADAVALATAAGDKARDGLAFDEAARWYRRAPDPAAAPSVFC